MTSQYLDATDERERSIQILRSAVVAVRETDGVTPNINAILVLSSGLEFRVRTSFVAIMNRLNATEKDPE